MQCFFSHIQLIFLTFCWSTYLSFLHTGSLPSPHTHMMPLGCSNGPRVADQQSSDTHSFLRGDYVFMLFHMIFVVIKVECDLMYKSIFFSFHLIFSIFHFPFSNFNFQTETHRLRDLNASLKNSLSVSEGSAKLKSNELETVKKK